MRLKIPLVLNKAFSCIFEHTELNNIKIWEFRVQWLPLNFYICICARNLYRAKYILAVTKIWTVFDPNNNCFNDLFATFSTRTMKSSYFSPVDLSSMENFERMSTIDFDFLSNIRATYYGSIIFESWLNKVCSLINICVRHIHWHKVFI